MKWFVGFLFLFVGCTSAFAGHPRTYVLRNYRGQVYAVDVTPRPIRTTSPNRGINKIPYNPIFDSPSRHTACRSGRYSARSSVGGTSGTGAVTWSQSYSGRTASGAQPKYIDNPYVKTPNTKFFKQLDARYKAYK